MIGQRIAIHAGKTWDPAGLTFIRRLGLECPDDGPEHPLGIIGTVRLTGSITTISAAKGQQALYSRWYMGAVGWLVEDPKELEKPLEVSGRQKLWRVPSELLEQLSA